MERKRRLEVELRGIEIFGDFRQRIQTEDKIIKY